MINYQETRKTMDMRGIEYNDTQFLLSVLIAIGIDKYNAYKLIYNVDKILK